MSAPGINWHQVIGGSAIKLNATLTLARATGYNIVWLGADAANTGTIYVGFNSNLTVPSAGAASATDGWPLAKGTTLPILIGELLDVGNSLYAIASAPAQDLYILGY
jgi:hypothetical protein